MSLEDECNWILSGREPLPNDLNGYCDPDDDSGADDNTLDDISGDEVNVVLAGINETWTLSIIYILIDNSRNLNILYPYAVFGNIHLNIS